MTGGMMGRGSDTRLYNSRSESSTMFRYNDGYESRYNPGDPEYLDAEKEKKQKEQDKQEQKLKNRKHVKVTPALLQQFKDEPSVGPEDDSEKIDADRELSAITGPPGNGGFLTSLATQAKGPGAAGGHAIFTSEPMDNAWSSLLKSFGESADTAMLRPLRESGRADDKEAVRERRKKFKPSTGQFKTGPGGMSGGINATERSYKAKRRGVTRGKKRGMMQAPLSVEMEHRAIATKQPMSKDPGAYRSYMGAQGGRKRTGNVRVTESTPNPKNPRSYKAGQTGAGTIQSKLPSEMKPKVPRPRLKPHRAPPIVPPRISGMPHLNMGGSTQSFSPRMSNQSMSMIGKSRKMTWGDKQELRILAQKVARLLDKKENKKKGKGDKDTSGGGSNLPKHPSNSRDQTSKPNGPTENIEEEEMHGADPVGIYTSRAGRTA
tara:strand:- start:17092 stop:18390 length:1299 start_codon:yes stop_codon:yes gene_type:complete